MRPSVSILDASFRYAPSFATSVVTTWRRAGWRPTTDDERKARQRSAVSDGSKASHVVPHTLQTQLNRLLVRPSVHLPSLPVPARIASIPTDV